MLLPPSSTTSGASGESGRSNHSSRRQSGPSGRRLVATISNRRAGLVPRRTRSRVRAHRIGTQHRTSLSPIADRRHPTRTSGSVRVTTSTTRRSATRSWCWRSGTPAEGVAHHFGSRRCLLAAARLRPSGEPRPGCGSHYAVTEELTIPDANVPSALMRTNPEAVVVQWLDRQPADSVWLSSIRVFETWFGLALLRSARYADCGYRARPSRHDRDPEHQTLRGAGRAHDRPLGAGVSEVTSGQSSRGAQGRSEGPAQYPDQRPVAHLFSLDRRRA